MVNNDSPSIFRLSLQNLVAVFIKGQSKLEVLSSRLYCNHKKVKEVAEKLANSLWACARKTDTFDSDVSETILPELLKNMSILGESGALKDQSGWIILERKGKILCFGSSQAAMLVYIQPVVTSRPLYDLNPPKHEITAQWHTRLTAFCLTDKKSIKDKRDAKNSTH